MSLSVDEEHFPCTTTTTTPRHTLASPSLFSDYMSYFCAKFAFALLKGLVAIVVVARMKSRMKMALLVYFEVC